MDPLSAFGLAANVIQVITFTTDLVSKSRQLHHSAQSSLVENIELESIAQTLQSHNRRIAYQLGKANISKSTAAKDLAKLCKGVRELCNQLIETLESLKMPDSATRWDSFRQALRSIWKEQQIADLMQRLELYRRQIDSILIANLQERLEFLVQETQNRDERIENNLSKILDLLGPRREWQIEVSRMARQTLDADPADTVAYLDLVSASLTAGAKEEWKVRMLRRTLESLKFADMRDRYERIAEAHQKTFEWIFRESSQDQQGNNFNSWLMSNRPLYWITGKPGAGKSTLCKFLFDDERIRSRLQIWQADLPIYTGRFFFWNSGTTMQMSRTGLLRSLLHDILSSFPDKIPVLFPDRWHYQEHFGYDSRPWSWSELSKAFTKLVLDRSKAFFFLIDGLDELDGDCSELAKFLLGHLSPDANLKLCVASRPWPVFEDAFKLQPSLRVEDLTAADIQRFASEKLSEHVMFAQLQKYDQKRACALVDALTQKASGVFLWVRLVVKSLLDGLRDGDRLEDLQLRLLRIPPDLQSVFQEMLNSLDPAYLDQASEIFQTIRASHVPRKEIHMLSADMTGPISRVDEEQDLDHSSSLRLLSLSFIGEDVQIALSRQEIESMNPGEQNYRAEAMRRRLYSRCKGLLEVPTFDKSGPEAKVQYLHRTVKDFLEEDGPRHLLTSRSGIFDAHVALCAALIRHTKAISPNEDEEMSRMMAFADLLLDFITQCHWIEKQGKDDYVPFLQEMDTIATAILGGAPMPHWTRRVDPYVGRRITFIHCLFDYAVVRSLTQYVLRCLADGYSVDENPNREALSHYVLNHCSQKMADILGLDSIVDEEQ